MKGNQQLSPNGLKYLIRKWTPLPSPSNPKNLIRLAGNDSLSPAFNETLGKMNTTNIYGLDDNLIKVAVFEALLEMEASHQYLLGGNRALLAIENINVCSPHEKISVSFKLTHSSKLLYRLNFGDYIEGTWVELLCKVFNLPKLDAIATLADILKISHEKIFQLSSERHSAELNGRSRPTDDIPNVLYLSGLPAGSSCAELVEKRYVYGNANQRIGAILRYRLNGNDFCLPATVGNNVLCMGKFKPTAHFLNQHLIDQHLFAPVIFFQDMRTALAFERRLEKIVGHKPEEFIVTAHLGNDLTVLPWNYFHGRKVVFIPAPTKECMAMINPYKEYIMGGQANDFQIYPGFLLHSQPCGDLTNHAGDVTDAEAKLLRRTVWLGTVKDPDQFAAQLIEEAIPYKKFKGLWERLGIFKAPNEQSNCNEDSSFNSLSLFQPDTGLTKPLKTCVKDVTTEEIFLPGGFTMLHGLKDSGKSLICLSAAKAIISGGKLFEFFTTGESRNILYLDSETPKDLLAVRLSQLGLVAEIGNSLFLLSKFDLKGNDLPFSITDQKFRDNVEKIMRVHNCGYLVLDNLTSLMDDGRLYNSTTVSKLFADWVDSLTRQGLGVVMVSHTQEGPNAGTSAAKARGSEEFSIRAHSEIVLVRSTEILEKKLGTEAVQHMAAQDGLTVGVCFKVCKEAAVLQKKTFWLHLPLRAPRWKFLTATGADGKEIEVAQACSRPEQDLTIQDKPLLDELEIEDVATSSKLSSDEKAVYYMTKGTGTVKTADIAQKLVCCKRKARIITKSLEEKGLLEPNEGKGSQQGYRLKG
ncbi:AAA family ATPase [Desulfovibrio sp.]|uniref:AAA family ATPase n=1 Tax=Desulfovibrio sp. TaxID=885 RepID=UPI0025BB5EC4|nr:AAA family ATPase [Desulfovibrio sp.]